MRKPHVAVALMVTLIALVFASPASAGTSCVGNVETAPDGRIRMESGPFEGAGEYPFFEISADFVPIGESVAFTLKWRNVSGSARTIRVAREVLSLEGYASRYFQNGVNVTPKLKSGISLAYADVPPGASATLAVVVRNRAATQSDQGLQWLRGRYKGGDINACDALGPWMNNFG